jgi:hypothetical protein
MGFTFEMHLSMHARATARKKARPLLSICMNAIKKACMLPQHTHAPAPVKHCWVHGILRCCAVNPPPRTMLLHGPQTKLYLPCDLTCATRHVLRKPRPRWRPLLLWYTPESWLAQHLTPMPGKLLATARCMHAAVQKLPQHAYLPTVTAQTLNTLLPCRPKAYTAAQGSSKLILAHATVPRKRWKHPRAAMCCWRVHRHAHGMRTAARQLLQGSWCSGTGIIAASAACVLSNQAAALVSACSALHSSTMTGPSMITQPLLLAMTSLWGHDQIASQSVMHIAGCPHTYIE